MNYHQLVHQYNPPFPPLPFVGDIAALERHWIDPTNEDLDRIDREPDDRPLIHAFI